MEPKPTANELTPTKRALYEIRALKARLRELESSRNDPVAIVGLGVRLPGGASTPAAFWSLLDQGVDAIREIPAERWDVERYFDPDPAVPGKMYTRHGGFLEAVERLRRTLLRHIATRGCRYRSPTAVAAGN